MNPRWIEWAQKLQAIAQTGLAYDKDPFDRERYEAVRRIAAEIASSHSEALFEHVHELFTLEAGHATPKVDVRGAVFRDNAILLVKERSDGLWTLPGGWADVGESPSEAVAREVYEESGYRTRPTKLLALYDRTRHGHPPISAYVYRLFFQCEVLTERTPSPSIEIENVAFFDEGEMPDLSLSRITPAQIERMYQHHRHPDLPADFD